MTAPEARPEGGALGRCVGDAASFLEDAYSRRPHLHHAGDGAFDDLLSIDDVDRLLTTTSPRAPAFRLVRDGSVLPRGSYTRGGTLGGQRLRDLPDVGRVLRHVEEGATLVMQGLHRYHEPLSRFCRDLELRLTQPVQANAYLTPPGSAGLDVHHDTHDVFALQTYGRKHWVVHEPAVRDPLSSQRWSSDEHEAGSPLLDVELEPGDALYVPRGTPHAAETLDEPSLHITIGIRATTWHDVLRDVVELAADEVAFREALPVGYAHDPDAFAAEVATRLKQAAAWVESVDAGRVARRAARRFTSSRRPLLDGQLRQVLELDHIGEDTVLERRPGTVARLEREDDRAVLHLGDRTVRFPAALAPVLGRILAADRLTVGDLDELDPHSRSVLARRLVREGLLVARPDA
ncbi:MAG: cupin domain-containing protein [Actinobacteria bacterium]|nr:cupin domain-containing protein [Actinomycetota bacterium]